jgi:hypothetical protein
MSTTHAYSQTGLLGNASIAARFSTPGSFLVVVIFSIVMVSVYVMAPVHT